MLTIMPWSATQRKLKSSSMYTAVQGRQECRAQSPPLLLQMHETAAKLELQSQQVSCCISSCASCPWIVCLHTSPITKMARIICLCSTLLHYSGTNPPYTPHCLKPTSSWSHLDVPVERFHCVSMASGGAYIERQIESLPLAL